MSVAAQIEAAAARHGSISFDRYMDLALYGEPDGFFTQGRGAGRADRDFVTSPEVGPLFGAVVARAIDRIWVSLGMPDPFVVMECGAGHGRLAREVLRAAPACTKALRYVLVERSEALRAAQRESLPIEPADEALGSFAVADRDDAPEPVAGMGPIMSSLAELPAVAFDGVVLANELLDNLPFGLAQHDGEQWWEVRVAAGPTTVLAPATASDAARLDAVFATPVPGGWVPIPRGIDDWFLAAARSLRRGSALLFDYTVAADDVAARTPGWLRTYRDHRRGHDPFAAPGEHDITADLVLEQVERAALAAGFAAGSVTSQADWLAAHHLADLVAEGARIWAAGADRGDLVALEGASRATQAALLTAPDGLGGFSVLEFARA